MSAKAGLSVYEKLLLAAYEVENRGRSPLSAEDLVVAAWRKFPDTFGLSGFTDEGGNLSYPDSNRVFAEIMGSKPIRKRGLLIKVGNKMYQLTEAGRHLARRLSSDPVEAGVEKAGLGRGISQQLRNLLNSRAVAKVRSRQIDDLTFYDACAFWGINPTSSAIELEGKIANLENVVESARKAARAGTATFEHGGQPFGAAELNTLLEAHRVLLGRFHVELDVIRMRRDERKA